MKLPTTLKLCLSILLGALACRLPAAELVPPEAIDAIAKDVVDGGWAYGMAIGLVNEHGTQTAGYGRMSESNAAAPDAESVFEIGSITKVFTGLVLAQMVEENVVSLDEPVQALLGDSIKMPMLGEHPITLVDLSTHSSGLPRMPSNFNPQNPNDPFADYTVDQMADFLAKHKLRRDPGTQYEYSNLAVGLLGHALALKNGKSYEQMVRTRICEPLGMSDTVITLDGGQQDRLAAGHDAAGQPASNWSLPTLAGAGALRSTVNDMLKFLQANLGLVHTPFDAAIADSHVVRFPISKDGGGVALGWHVTPAGVIWHNGGTGGYHCYAGFLPEKKIGVVVLSNSTAPQVDAVGQRLLDLLVTGKAEPLNLPRAIQLDAAAIEPFVGRYKLDQGPKILVTRNEDTLQLQVVGQPRIELLPQSPTRFFARVDADIAVTFETDGGGKASKLVIHQGGHDVLAVREE